MRTCAVIGASEEAAHAINVAHDAGLRVVAIDGNADAAGLRYADESLVIDIMDYGAVTGALAERFVDLILPVPIGAALLSTGAANDRLGLVGVSESSVRRCVDKWLYHNEMDAIGMRSIRCQLISGGHLPVAFGSYPCIVKPRFGSGSRSVQLVDSSDELKRVLDSLDSTEDYVVEEKVEGVEYGVDAAVVDGRLSIVLLREKLNTPPPFCQCVGYLSVPGGSPLYDAARSMLSAAASALGIDNCVLHADVINSDAGMFPVELSPRPSGHRLHDLFTPYCTGVDMVAEYLGFAFGAKYRFEPRSIRPALIRYFDFPRCRITSVPDREELFERYPGLAMFECQIRAGDLLCDVVDGRSLMGRGYMVLHGGSRESLIGDSEAILNSFGREVADA